MATLIAALVFSASQIALNNLLTDFVTSLQDSAPNTAIPNQYISYQNTRMTSTLGILLKNIQINTLSIPTHSISMNSNREILISLSNISLNLSFSYDYLINFLSDSGQASLSVSNGNLLITLQVQNTSLLQVTNKDTKLDLTGLNIQIIRPGGVNANWLFQMFNIEIEDLITQAFSTLVTDTINQYSFGDMYYKLAGYDLGFDYSLTEPPWVSDVWLGVKSKGIFVQDSKKNYTPPIPQPGTVQTEVDTGMQLVFADYLVNSLSYSAYSAGLLDLNISNSTFTNSPVELSTTVIGFFFPEIIEKYGLDKPVSFFCSFDKSPLVQFIENQDWSVQVNSTEALSCDMYVEQNVSMVVDGTLNFAAQFYLDNWKVKGNIMTLNITNVNVVSTQINFNSNSLQTNINAGLDAYRTSVNNDLLLNGIQLTTSERFNLTSTKIKSGNGFVLVFLTPSINFDLGQFVSSY